MNKWGEVRIFAFIFVSFLNYPYLMLTRRTLRIKAFQTIYQTEITGARSEGAAMINRSLQDSPLLLVFLIEALHQITHYAYQDTDYKKKRKSEERFFNTASAAPRLSQNPVLLALRTASQTFLTEQKLTPVFWEDEDVARILFYQLKKTVIYEDYLKTETLSLQMHKEMLCYLIEEVLLSSELLESLVHTHFIEAAQDCSEIVHYLYQYISTYEAGAVSVFASAYKNISLASELVAAYQTHHQHCKALVYRFVQHWEKDRICLSDKILICMGVCEFLYFPDIPVRVSINEYLEIAKAYSTDKSKHFINGILDSIYKHLWAEKQIPESKY